MTRKQIERSADCLHELAVAVFLGSVGDLILVNSRNALDASGIGLSVLMFAFSLKLTGWLGGPKI